MRKWLTGIGRTMKNIWKHKIKANQAWYKHYRVLTAQLEREYESEREKK